MHHATVLRLRGGEVVTVLASIAEPIGTSLREGTIPERIVIVVGALVLAFGLWQFLQVLLGLYGVFLAGEDVELFTTTLRFFLATFVGIVAIVLGTYLEFDDLRGSGH